MERVLNQAKQRIDALLNREGQVYVAIDGKCTSGKTTLAAKLAQIYDCNVLHMDEFFLRPEQRTLQRFDQVGGNVDYERFWQEVLLPLKKGEAFSYRPFDCSTFTLAQPVQVQPKKLNIIEGTYSFHPYFGNAYDLRLLLTVTPEVQRQRVLQRPEFLQDRFFNVWIPMENRYFEAMQPEEMADVVIL